MKTYIKEVRGSAVSSDGNKYRTVTDIFYLSIYDDSFSHPEIYELTSDCFRFLPDTVFKTIQNYLLSGKTIAIRRRRCETTLIVLNFEVVYFVFQFLMVRLKVDGVTKVKTDKEFQFLMVRLKAQGLYCPLRSFIYFNSLWFD